MEIQDIEGPGVGVFPKDTFGTGWNRTAGTLALGDLVMCDMADTDTGTTTSLVVGNDGNIMGNFIVPGTNGIGGLSGATIRAGFFFGIVVDLLDGAGADDTKVRVQWQGVVKKASLAAAAVTPGVSLYGANGVKTLTSATAAANKVLGFGWEPNGSAAGLFQIIFDGINGFGAPAAS